MSDPCNPEWVSQCAMFVRVTNVNRTRRTTEGNVRVTVGGYNDIEQWEPLECQK